MPGSRLRGRVPNTDGFARGATFAAQILPEVFPKSRESHACFKAKMAAQDDQSMACHHWFSTRCRRAIVALAG